jgi:hypothetical protein
VSRSRLEPALAAESRSRLESARERAAAARRGIAVAAIASFGVALVFVRASHPAVSTGSTLSGLKAPSAFVAQIQGSTLGGGSIASAAGPPVAATSTS